MDSSAAWSDSEAAKWLGQQLTGSEAKGIADRLCDGDTLTTAIRVVPPGRRAEIRSLLEGIDAGAVIAVLRAVEGARSITTTLDPLWTMPGHLAQAGPLTSSVAHLVDGARQSVTCSTFNFQRTSGLWEALRRAARRPEIALRVYLDTKAADQDSRRTPTTSQVAAHLRPGTILRTREFDGSYVRNHAKFLIVDHRFLLTTSANFSWSAEHGNLEFGVFIDSRNLSEAVEREMLRTEEFLFERVPTTSS
ncbi:DISARM system phospholipase D-like protein DrmC [Streptosporangium sp. 'caverna']|uniref:DISARM system phospholipase D-like protein DrmC n=1 Tax=Streptosporangium sp. 'caverna' TaxID=2202249 RepID=UPI000D7E8595|nr:DISARM system phospholipase D-like protein DrmC [Streptosporangium sp. 'caverna']AWS44511.1 phospholipase [Streptosporangium sp. 'caverna']